MKKLAALILIILSLAGTFQATPAAAGTHVFFGEWIEFEEGGFMLYLPDTWTGMDLTELLASDKREKVDVMSIYGDAPMVYTVNIMCWSDMITEDMSMEEIRGDAGRRDQRLARHFLPGDWRRFDVRLHRLWR